MALNHPSTLRFLALCARPKIGEGLRDRLATEAVEIDRWDLLVLAAEYHEIVGLLYSHLRSAGVELPRDPRRTLEGFVARARHSTSTHLQVLAEILGLFRAEGIATLVLKGGALAPTLYSEIGHRSLADLDLWVEPRRIEEAQAALLQRGFRSHPAHGLPSHRHLAPISRELDGVRIVVELHRTVAMIEPQGSADLLARATTFSLEGQQAQTLAPADSLAQLHDHLVYHLVFHRSLRLKWVADMIGLAERFSATIDWTELRSRYPAMPGALAMLHHLSPLSPTAIEDIGITVETVAPRGIEQEISVLPRPLGTDSSEVVVDIPDRPAWLSPEGDRTIRDTFWPSAWRLRLFWGLDRDAGLLIARLRYLARVLAFGIEIWRSHAGSWVSLSRRPWFRSRLPPTRRRDNRE